MTLLKDLEPELDEEKGDLWFTCPICKNHSIAVSWKLPSYHQNGTYLWRKTGTSVDDISLEPSINLDLDGSTCKFHGWVKNGEVTW